MRILIATDAWFPQVNGVVRTLTAVAERLGNFGVEVVFLTPEGMTTFALPSYPDIRVALPSPRKVAAHIDALAPDAIHIATEGPIGLTARWYCRSRRKPFTTSFHTRFPEYLAARWPVPPWLSWSWLRWFHNGSVGTMAATSSLADELCAHGFRHVTHWPRGVDAQLFRPRPDASFGLLRPIFLSVGRWQSKRTSTRFSRSTCPAPKS